MFFASAKQTIHAISQNTRHLYYTLGLSPRGPLSLPPAGWKQPRRNLLRIRVYFGSTEEREHTGSAKRRSIEGCVLPGILLKSRSPGSNPETSNLNGTAEQRPESGDDCLLEGSWTLERGSHGGGEDRGGRGNALGQEDDWAVVNQLRQQRWKRMISF